MDRDELINTLRQIVSTSYSVAHSETKSASTRQDKALQDIAKLVGEGLFTPEELRKITS